MTGWYGSLGNLALWLLSPLSALKAMMQPNSESQTKAPSALRYVAEFNVVTWTIMAIVYYYPAMYVLGCGVVCLIVLPAYTRFTADYASLCVLFSVMHATFHDFFMDGMGICDNAFVDSHLHYAMLWCVFKLLPKDQQVWFCSSKVIRATLCANFLNCVLGMCLPALVNFKETGILDLKYSHACTSINRLQDWEYIVYGLTSLPSTIAIACYFIAGTIVVCTNYSIHISKAIWIALGVFSGSTAAYFFVDPLWLVSFYNQIKYDQLYFVVPSLYLYLSPFSKQPQDSPNTSSTSSKVRRLNVDELEDESTNPVTSKTLDASLSACNTGLTILEESGSSFTYARWV